MIKTAIVHDWIITLGGAEKCLESIYNLYPSPIYALVAKEESIRALSIEANNVTQSFLKNFPNVEKWYRSYLPFYPLAIEQLDLSNYNVVISSSHAAAKGVLTNANQLHICYCYTPMRYAWDLYHQYLSDANLTKGLKGWLAKKILHYMRIWDYTSTPRVDHFIAISKHIARRIKKLYGRDSTVIYPPVDINKFEVCEKKEDFYLTASRMVPYKKINLIVEAFSEMPDKKLIVIGDGPDFPKIKQLAKKNIELLGYQPFATLKRYLEKAKAFVFAAEEDFGIIPVEAQACGTPIIAYGKGGALETVVSDKTGIFFQEQTIESLKEGIKKFESQTTILSPQLIRKNSELFSKERFETTFKEFVNTRIKDFF